MQRFSFVRHDACESAAHPLRLPRAAHRTDSLLHPARTRIAPGRYFPLELHIVHRVTDPALPACAGGCFSVLGILFEVYDGPDNVLLKTIWDNMPMREGVRLGPRAEDRWGLAVVQHVIDSEAWGAPSPNAACG